MTDQRRISLWAMTALLLLVSALAIPAINRDALWFDEYYSIFESGGAHFGPLSPVDMWLRVASYSVWPPLYNTAIAIWGTAAGWSTFSGRFFSILLGLLTLAVVCRCGADIGSSRRAWLIGLTNAAVLGGSAFFVYYTHEYRGYTLHLLLVSLSIWLYWRLATRTPVRPARGAELAFVAVLVMLLYSHPVGQVVFGALGLYHLVVRFRQPGWWRGLGWFVLAGMGYAPWVIIMFMRVYQELQASRGLDAGLVLGSLVAIFSNGVPVLLGVPLVGLLVAGRGRAVGYLGFLAAAIVALALIIDRVVPFLFHPRLVLAVLPVAALLTARGMAALPRPALVSAAFLAVWGVLGVALSLSTWDFIYTFPGTVRPISWPGFAAAVARLNEAASPSDVALFQVTEFEDEKWTKTPLDFYLEGSPWRYAQIGLEGRASTAEAYARHMVAFVASAPRVWLAADPRVAHPSTPLLQTVLERLGFARCPASVDLPDMRLRAFVRSGRAGTPLGTCP